MLYPVWLLVETVLDHQERLLTEIQVRQGYRGRKVPMYKVKVAHPKSAWQGCLMR